MVEIGIDQRLFVEKVKEILVRASLACKDFTKTKAGPDKNSGKDVNLVFEKLLSLLKSNEFLCFVCICQDQNEQLLKVINSADSE